MTMTQADLDALLARNPRLRVRGVPQKRRELNAEFAPSAASNKEAKYWNIKVFVQEQGISASSPDESLGKVLEKYDSIKEYQWNNELLLLLKTGKIHDLCRQKAIIIQEAFAYGDETVS